MTTTGIPDWAWRNPPRPPEPASTYQWANLTEAELQALRKKLIESILQVVTQDLTGGLLPGPAGQQLSTWAGGLLDATSGIAATAITGVMTLAQLPATLLTTASSLAASLITGQLSLANLPSTVLTTASTIASTAITGTMTLAQLPSSLLTNTSSLLAGNITGTVPLTNLPASLLTTASSIATSQLSGLATGVGSWLTGGGALPGATTLPTSGLTGLGTGIGSWLTGGGALPSATSLLTSQLSGTMTLAQLPGTLLTTASSLAAGNITGVVNLANLPATMLTTASSLLAGNLTGTVPLGTLPSSVLTTASGIATTQLTGLGTGVQTWLGSGGALPSGATAAISQITQLPGQLATMFSPFNPPHAIGPGQITTDPQNLLVNPTLSTSDALQGELVWVWDSVTHAPSGGSAKVLANTNANVKALLSNAIQVAANDTINASAWAQWSALTYTGAPISLRLNIYDAANSLITQVTLATATMTGATSSWVQLAGLHQITEAGAAWVRLVFYVGTTATAGSVWFSDASLTKPNQIPQEAVQSLTGILGGTDVGTTIQDFVDKGVQGIVNDPGSLVNNSLATFNQQISSLARFLGYVTSGAAPTNSVAQIASAVDNTVKARAVQKAFNENIDPTTDATFPLSQVWQNTTLPVVASTSGATVLGDVTIRDGGNKNAVTWYGYPSGGNFGSISDFRVNIWSINKTTNVRTLVHGSANLIGTVGTGSAPVFNSYNLPSSITNTPGDRLTAEIAILGAGTYYLVGQTISPQIPFHSVYGLHGLTRASATAPSTMNPPGVGGSPLSYSRAIPWIGLSGVASATQYSPVIIPFYSNGSFDPTLYQWANYMDAIVCGPGGRGADGAGYWGGNAGSPGSWNSADGIPKSVWGAVTTTVNITNGASQTASGITIPGWGTLVGPAGANNANVSATSNLGAPAAGPGDRYDNGQRYPGGNGGATAQASGGQPGGGGAGGNAPFTVGQNIYGGNGGPGIAYLRLYQ